MRAHLLILPSIAAGKLAGQVEDAAEAVVCRVCVRDMLLRFKPCMTEFYLHIYDARAWLIIVPRARLSKLTAQAEHASLEELGEQLTASLSTLGSEVRVRSISISSSVN